MTEPNRQSGENEERIIEIEIERLRPFKEHPFQVKDECKKCRSTLEIFVKDDMVSVRPIHIRDEQLKSRMRTYSRKMMNQGS